MEYETRITRLIVAPVGDPVFSEQATTIEIDDEAGGEFVVVKQFGGHTDYEKAICINPDEWPHIKSAIEQLFAICRK